MDDELGARVRQGSPPPARTCPVIGDVTELGLGAQRRTVPGPG